MKLLTRKKSEASTEETLTKARSGRISLKWHLFIWLSMFTAVILLILWLCQVVFLDAIYKNIKMGEISHAARLLTDSVAADSIGTTAESVSKKNDICVLVLRMVDSDSAVEIYSVEALRTCLIHNAEKNSIFVFYDNAEKNGGSCVQHYRYSGERRSYVSSENPVYESLPQDNESIIYSVITTDSDGSSILILLNSVISPVTATVNTLNRLLVAISAVLILLALFMATLISRRISRPIASLGSDAKRLATGDYSVEFRTNGYREIRELADSLEYAEHELSKVDSLRRELIANISHDLRTPLTMISGYAEIMRDIPDENTPENLQIIIDESGRLSSLVNDVLDISKLESGVRSVNPSRFCITDEIRSAVDRYNKLMGNRGYLLEFSGDGDRTLETDRTILMQVFYNLVNNALTYTGEDKKIYIKQETDPEHKTLRVSVTDTGEGIEKDKLPLIWDRYYKVDKVHRRAAVGTGLGLSIVRRSMELLGGGYGVISEPGKGSTFWFDIPYVE